MKKLVLALALSALLTLTAQAEEKPKHVCESIGDLAEVIMQKRQGGADLTEILGLAGDNAAIRGMVLSAYEEANYNSQQYKNKAIRDFKERFVLACYKQ